MSERFLFLALLFALLFALSSGCSLLPAPLKEPPAESEPVTTAPPDPAKWVLDPIEYGKRIRAYDPTQRRNLTDEALTEFAARPGIATHTRLALVLDNAVVALREHVETAIRIEHMLDGSLEPQVAAVLWVQLDRINARVAAMQNLAATSKSVARLTRQLRELEVSQSESEAALEVAQEKIEALKSIEQSLRRQ